MLNTQPFSTTSSRLWRGAPTGRFTSTRSCAFTEGGGSLFRHVLRRLKGWILALAIIALVSLPAIAQDNHVRLAGTQTILLETGSEGPGALATVAVDLALGPRWNLTYIHDLSWRRIERWRAHDVGVTRYAGGGKDISTTLGFRVKIPDDDQPETTAYLLVAWRWGR